MPHTTIFHRIQADAKGPIYGNEKNPVVKDKYQKEITKVYKQNEIRANSGFRLVDAGVYKDASKQEWYLKGMRMETISFLEVTFLYAVCF